MENLSGAIYLSICNFKRSREGQKQIKQAPEWQKDNGDFVILPGAWSVAACG
ncbi:predicted protein [Botrytis cinerea T4]|uniref:Uncharacterized protein n=1 Tax=Botryotinia fuckeliana (strain T4) TaxID=999810 RepID=G2YIN3_BOTF4|nr:predicted protein [Botrytis cinerea T4]